MIVCDIYLSSLSFIPLVPFVTLAARPSPRLSLAPFPCSSSPWLLSLALLLPGSSPLLFFSLAPLPCPLPPTPPTNVPPETRGHPRSLDPRPSEGSKETSKTLSLTSLSLSLTSLSLLSFSLPLPLSPLSPLSLPLSLSLSLPLSPSPSLSLPLSPSLSPSLSLTSLFPSLSLLHLSLPLSPPFLMPPSAPLPTLRCRCPPPNPNPTPLRNFFFFSPHQVTFQLHHSFDNPNRDTITQPFEVSEAGWGEFTVGVRLTFRTDARIPDVDLFHPLKLYGDTTTTTTTTTTGSGIPVDHHHNNKTPGSGPSPGSGPNQNNNNNNNNNNNGGGGGGGTNNNNPSPSPPPPGVVVSESYDEFVLSEPAWLLWEKYNAHAPFLKAAPESATTTPFVGAHAPDRELQAVLDARQRVALMTHAIKTQLGQA